MKTWKHVTLLVLAGLLVAVGARAYDRAPLFWQTEVFSNGVTVRRLHDAEAQAYCYVTYTAEVDGSIRNVGQNQPLSISCVKVR